MPRPPTRAGINGTTQREIVWWLAQGCTKEDAARRAGLPDTYRLHAFARTEGFAVALRQALQDHLATNLAPEAVKILSEIMRDDKVQSRVRVDAAKAILDRSGFAAGNGEHSGVSGDVHEMSIAQLEAFITEREGKLKVVGPQTIDVEADEVVDDVEDDMEPSIDPAAESNAADAAGSARRFLG